MPLKLALTLVLGLTLCRASSTGQEPDLESSSSESYNSSSYPDAASDCKSNDDGSDSSNSSDRELATGSQEADLSDGRFNLHAATRHQIRLQQTRIEQLEREAAAREAALTQAQNLLEKNTITCLICCESVTDPDKSGCRVISILKCDHKFHNSCIMPWLRRKQTCPTCNGSVTDADVSMLDTGGDPLDSILTQMTRLSVTKHTAALRTEVTRLRRANAKLTHRNVKLERNYTSLEQRYGEETKVAKLFAKCTSSAKKALSTMRNTAKTLKKRGAKYPYLLRRAEALSRRADNLSKRLKRLEEFENEIYQNEISTRMIWEAELGVNVGDAIEVNYKGEGTWFPATYKGRDPKRRPDYVAVEYHDRRGKKLGTMISTVRKSSSEPPAE